MSDAVTEHQARQIGQWRDIQYRSWPGGRDYSFTYALVDGSWRVFINNSPNYRGRSASSLDTHRLDIGGRAYVCWDQAINTLSEAQAVSALWADSTERYIATGRFEPPPGRPTPADRSVLNGFTAPKKPLADSPADVAAPVMAVPLRLDSAQPSAFTGGRATSPWYVDQDLLRWGGGLVGFTIFGLFWVICMHNGIGFWDVVWAAFAGACAYVAIRNADIQPGGRGWPIAYTVAGVVLGFVSLTGGAPGFLWAIVVLLALVNAGCYAYAAYEHEHGF